MWSKWETLMRHLLRRLHGSEGGRALEARWGRPAQTQDEGDHSQSDLHRLDGVSGDRGGADAGQVIDRNLDEACTA